MGNSYCNWSRSCYNINLIMDYEFYVKMDGQLYGPYNLDEVKELPLLDDTLVTESRLEGEWHPACEFDFNDLSNTLNEMRVMNNSNSSISSSPTCNNQEWIEGVEVSNPLRMQRNPSILNMWNWGAFALSWLWGIFNGLYWPLLIIACNFVPYAGPFIALGLSIYLGIYGNQLAWNAAKEKNDVDALSFTRLQRKWNLAGIIVFCVVMFLAIIGLFLRFCSGGISLS